MRIRFSFPFPRRSQAIGVLSLVTVVALLFSACLAQQKEKNRQPTARSTMQVTLNPSILGNKIASDFLGSSIEPFRMCEMVRLDRVSPGPVNMLMNLGHGTIRFGGDSVEFTHWDPNASSPHCDYNNTTINKALIDDVFKVVRKAGRRTTLSINLLHGKPATFADEAVYAITSGGSTLKAIEIGNEPDLYGWSYSQFQSSWEANYNAIKAIAPSATFVGPSVCCNSKWLGSFVNAESSRILVSTAHPYATNANNNPTIKDLLSQGVMNDMAREVDILVNAVKGRNIGIDLNETNAVANLPPESIGGAFAMSLWGLDDAFTVAEHGVSGIAFHGAWPGDATSPFNSNDTSIFPRPLYYGMLAFHYATGETASIIPVQVNSSTNLRAHAVLRSDGKLSVIVINKDQHNADNVQINTTKSYSSANALWLTAPSVSAQVDSISFGGSKVASNGTWAPTQVKKVSVNGATSSISLPADSAVVITYE